MCFLLVNVGELSLESSKWDGLLVLLFGFFLVEFLRVDLETLKVESKRFRGLLHVAVT